MLTFSKGEVLVGVTTLAVIGVPQASPTVADLLQQLEETLFSNGCREQLRDGVLRRARPLSDCQSTNKPLLAGLLYELSTPLQSAPSHLIHTACCSFLLCAIQHA